MRPKAHYVVCTDDRECDDLKRRRIYPVLVDEEADKEGYLRVIDDSGEDYLYSAGRFLEIEISPRIEEALELAS